MNITGDDGNYTEEFRALLDEVKQRVHPLHVDPAVVAERVEGVRLPSAEVVAEAMLEEAGVAPVHRASHPEHLAHAEQARERQLKGSKRR